MFNRANLPGAASYTTGPRQQMQYKPWTPPALPAQAAPQAQAATQQPGPSMPQTPLDGMGWLSQLFGGKGMMGGFLGPLLGGDLPKVQSLLGGLDLSSGTPYSRPQPTSGMQQGTNGQGFTTLGRTMPGLTQVPSYLQGQPSAFNTQARNMFRLGG